MMEPWWCRIQPMPGALRAVGPCCACRCPIWFRRAGGFAGGLPLLPHPAWLTGKGGRPSRYCMRDVVDGIRYLTHNGPTWRALPADFPPAWTVYY